MMRRMKHLGPAHTEALMDSSVIAFAEAMVLAVVLIGSGLTFYSLRLRHRSRGNPELENDLRDQIELEAERRAALEARLAELEERVDFTERRLIQRAEKPAATPV
jgi:hypothetical protein